MENKEGLDIYELSETLNLSHKQVLEKIINEQWEYLGYSEIGQEIFVMPEKETDENNSSGTMRVMPYST